MEPAHVIVGVGDPPRHLHTLRWAAAEAAHRGMKLRVIHAARPDACHSLEFPEATALHHAATVVTAAVAEARRWAPGIAVEGDAVLGGPAATLVAAAGPRDLLVVGNQDRAVHALTGRGPTCEQVALRARSSVAVVRGSAGPESGPVAVGYDGSPAAEQALALAFESASTRGCGLTVIRVTRSLTPGLVDDPRTALTVRATLTAEARLAVAPLADKYPDVPVDILVVGGDPALQLVRASHDARLIVVGSRHPAGPVWPHLLRHAHCPVLIVRL